MFKKFLVAVFCKLLSDDSEGAALDIYEIGLPNAIYNFKPIGDRQLIDADFALFSADLKQSSLDG